MRNRGSILILVASMLAALFVGEMVFFAFAQTPAGKTESKRELQKKEIVYHRDVGGNLDEINEVVISGTKLRDGISSNFLTVEKGGKTDLSGYSRIRNLVIEDIDASWLRNIDGLKIYSLSVNNVKNFDISRFDTSKLESLYITDSKIKNTAMIKELTGIKNLSMTQMELENLDFLSGFDSLEYLNLYQCDIKDFSALEKIKRIEYLNICSCQIDDASFLENCDIEALTLSDNNLTDLSFTKNMTNLTRLCADGNEISGEVSLENLKKLQNIDLRFNKITGITFDSDVISSINLAYNDIEFVGPELIGRINKSGNGAEYFSVNLFGNIIENIDEIRNCKYITFNDEVYYTFTPEQYSEYVAAVRGIASCIDETWTDTQKAVAVYDYIIHNTEYDYETEVADSFGNICHTGYAALVKQKAVCDGFAYALRDVLRYAGIESYIYHGDVSSQTDNSTHAWNLICLDGKWYHCDVTGGVTLSGATDEIDKYFARSDREMRNMQYFLLDEEAPECKEALRASYVNEIVSETRQFTQGEESSDE